MAKRRRKPKRLSDQLRQAVAECDESRYAISMATGIDQSVLSKFVRGERGLSLDTVDVLAAHLELELRPAKNRRK